MHRWSDSSFYRNYYADTIICDEKSYLIITHIEKKPKFVTNQSVLGLKIKANMSINSLNKQISFQHTTQLINQWQFSIFSTISAVRYNWTNRPKMAPFPEATFHFQRFRKHGRKLSLIFLMETHTA